MRVVVSDHCCGGMAVARSEVVRAGGRLRPLLRWHGGSTVRGGAGGWSSPIIAAVAWR